MLETRAQMVISYGFKALLTYKGHGGRVNTFEIIQTMFLLHSTHPAICPFYPNICPTVIYSKDQPIPDSSRYRQQI
jgi:hypothetical protein